MKKRLVHICTNSDWQEALALGRYKPRSLSSDGFIHLSRTDQVLKVANAYFSGKENLILLWIDPEVLDCEVRWEKSDGGTFPHLYGSLNIESVVCISWFTADDDGVFRELPEDYS
jgi:uncharacterized protein (DUF952 family)